MAMLHFRRAVRDMGHHRLLNLVTVVTIAMTILIVGAAGVFFLNASDLLNTWKQGVRITAYLKDGFGAGKRQAMVARIRSMHGVEDVRFISKTEALEQLKQQMSRQAAILEHLEENPLPDAFEIRMIVTNQTWDRIETLAGQLEALEGVNDVEYGQRWVGRLIRLFNLFQLSGYAMGGLLIIASVFIVGNTIRLVYYSRQEEVEIMRLVGATDRFILTPFYIQGTVQGLMGGTVGIGSLYLMFILMSAKVEHTGWLSLRFLPLDIITLIIFCSMMVGGLGCHLSLKQHFKS